MPATVDLQLDLLGSMFKVATTTWSCVLIRTPMTAVRSPKSFSERDRRLSDEEEERLLEAARHEDREWQSEQAVKALAADFVGQAEVLPTRYQRTVAVRLAYALARRMVLEAGLQHVPRYEAFVLFQPGTAARRGETLKLLRSNVDKDAQPAFLPETKNNRPRKLAIRKDLPALLDELPATASRLLKPSSGVFQAGVALQGSARRGAMFGRQVAVCVHTFQGVFSKEPLQGIFPSDSL